MKNQIERTFMKWSENIIQEMVDGFDDELQQRINEGNDPKEVLKQMDLSSRGNIFEGPMEVWMNQCSDDLAEIVGMELDEFEEEFL